MNGSMIHIKCGNPACGKLIKADTSKINPSHPVVKCPACHSANKVKLPKAAVKQPPKAQKEKVPGWLVKHTENQSSQTYTLKTGSNTIGRKASNYPVPDIQLTSEDVPYVSRGVHCTLEVVERNGQIEAIISDNDSSNGTFINGRDYRLSPGDEEYLEDGETIQAGRTKFVLKTSRSAASKKEAGTIVQQTNYSKTIIS